MAFDPTKPVAGAEIDAVELNNQFNGLNDNINTLADQVNNLPTAADVDYSIRAQSARNVDGIGALTLTISNPPTQAQVQAILNAFNTLLLALKH